MTHFLNHCLAFGKVLGHRLLHSHSALQGGSVRSFSVPLILTVFQSDRQFHQAVSFIGASWEVPSVNSIRRQSYSMRGKMTAV